MGPSPPGLRVALSMEFLLEFLLEFLPPTTKNSSSEIQVNNPLSRHVGYEEVVTLKICLNFRARGSSTRDSRFLCHHEQS